MARRVFRGIFSVYRFDMRQLAPTIRLAVVLLTGTSHAATDWIEGHWTWDRETTIAIRAQRDAQVRNGLRRLFANWPEYEWAFERGVVEMRLPNGPSKTLPFRIEARSGAFLLVMGEHDELVYRASRVPSGFCVNLVIGEHVDPSADCFKRAAVQDCDHVFHGRVV